MKRETCISTFKPLTEPHRTSKIIKLTRKKSQRKNETENGKKKASRSARIFIKVIKAKKKPESSNHAAELVDTNRKIAKSDRGTRSMEFQSLFEYVT